MAVYVCGELDGVVVVILSYQIRARCLINPLIFLLVDTLSPPPIDIMSG